MKYLLTVLVCSFFLVSCSEDLLENTNQTSEVEKTTEMLKFEQGLKGMGNKVMNSKNPTQKMNATVELNTMATEYLENNVVSTKKSNEPFLKQALDLHAQKLRELKQNNK